MMAILFLLYFFACLTVGMLGRDTTLGTFGTVVMSLLLTPFLALILILLFRPNRRLRETYARARLGTLDP